MKDRERDSPRLTIELVPRSSWFQNVRSEVSSDEWDAIRRAVYVRAGYRCEICGGVGPRHPVECHERWSYDEARGVNGKNIQRLDGMMALCPACHQVKHIGLASIRGHLDEALRHLAAVNGFSLGAAESYARECADVWLRRSEKEWEVDTSILSGPKYQRWKRYNNL